MYIISKYVSELIGIEHLSIHLHAADVASHDSVLLSLWYMNRWADVALGVSSGVFAFHQSQQKWVAEERRLVALLKRGYDVDKQKEKRLAEAELEKEASEELSKLFNSVEGTKEEQMSSSSR